MIVKMNYVIILQYVVNLFFKFSTISEFWIKTTIKDKTNLLPVNSFTEYSPSENALPVSFTLLIL